MDNYTFYHNKYSIKIAPLSKFIFVPCNDYETLKIYVNNLIKNKGGYNQCLNNNNKTTIYFNFGTNNEMKILIPLNLLLNQKVFFCSKIKNVEL